MLADAHGADQVDEGGFTLRAGEGLLDDGFELRSVLGRRAGEALE